MSRNVLTLRHLQGGRCGGGASSPLGPDSTWSDSEMTGHKMEARFAQMEARILKEQDEKFNKMMEAIGNISQKTASVSPVSETESSENLMKVLAELKDRMDLLQGGEKGANKLLDSVDRTSRDVKSLEKHLSHKIDKVETELKKLRDDHREKKFEDLLRDVSHSAKRTREESNDKLRDIKMKLEELMKAAVSPAKRGRSRSESCEQGSQRNRHGSNGSSRSRSRMRGRGTSREDSISSLSRSKTELEVVTKLDTLVTDLADFRKDIAPRKQIEEQMLNNIIKVAKLLEQQGLYNHQTMVVDDDSQF